MLSIKWRLREQIHKNQDTMKDLAKHIGITYQNLSKKMNGNVDFRRAEIKAIKDRYNLSAEQIDYLFFKD